MYDSPLFMRSCIGIEQVLTGNKRRCVFDFTPTGHSQHFFLQKYWKYLLVDVKDAFTLWCRQDAASIEVIHQISLQIVDGLLLFFYTCQLPSETTIQCGIPWICYTATNIQFWCPLGALSAIKHTCSNTVSIEKHALVKNSTAQFYYWRSEVQRMTSQSECIVKTLCQQSTFAFMTH